MKKKKTKLCASNQKHEETGKSWTCEKEHVKKIIMDLKKPITFDIFQRRFCIGICFMVVCEIYHVIVIVRSLTWPIVCYSKNELLYDYSITAKTTFTVKNTARINYTFTQRRQLFLITSSQCLCVWFSVVRAVQA